MSLTQGVRWVLSICDSLYSLSIAFAQTWTFTRPEGLIHLNRWKVVVSWMIANGHRTPDNLLLETERNNVQQVFILTRNRPLNGVQTRVYFLLKQGVLTGVWVYKYSAFPNYWSGTTIGWARWKWFLFNQQEAKLMGVKYTGTQGKEAMQRGGQP